MTLEIFVCSCGLQTPKKMTIQLGPTRDTNWKFHIEEKRARGRRRDGGGVSSAQTKILTSTMIGVN